jgi:hypothetical protein
MGLALPAQAWAASVVSQGFKVKEKLSTGQAVSLNDNTLNLLTPENQGQLYGVVISQQDAAISLTSDANQVQVVTSGPASVIVSDINGEVKTGDQLVASPITGVVMKGTESGKSLGVAQQDMASLSANYQKQTVKAKDGSSKSVNVVLLSAVVNIHDFQPNSPTTPAILLPLQAALSNTVGRQVSTTRVVIAMVILVVSLIAVLVILYAAASSSIRSVGRNPTAQSAIFLSLLQVVGIIAVIFMAAFGLIMVIIRG